MAGFGAGFAKGISGQLDAAGKLYQQEQLRAREYERAKADRQAERLEDRAWSQEDRAALRQQQLEDQDVEYSTKVEHYSKDADGNLYFTSPRTGNKTKVDPGSPMYGHYERKQIEFRQKDQEHALGIEATRANIAANRESAATSRYNRTAGAKIDMPKYVEAFGQSLAKNKDVYFRDQESANKFVRLLKQYGFKTGAELGREYARGNTNAIIAMDEAAEYLYFPEGDRTGKDGKLLSPGQAD